MASRPLGAALVALSVGAACTSTRVDLLADAGGDARACVPRLDDGLVAHWRFDEGQGNEARDASPTGANGLLIGGARFSSDLPPPLAAAGGSSLMLDGVDDYVSLSQDLARRLRPDATECAWVKVTPPPVDDTLLLNEPMFGAFTPDGTIEIAASHRTFYVGSERVATGKWRHVCTVLQDGPQRFVLAIDGVLQPPGSQDPNARDWDAPIDKIGRTGSSYLAGTIDDLRVYGRALTGNEIANLAAGKNADGTDLCRR